MGWKFWKKEAAEAPRKSKQTGPRDLPDAVGRQLVVEMELDPDWVWNLKSVVRRRDAERYIRDFRVFDPQKAREDGVSVRNYDSLESLPEQILFAGWYNTETGEVQLSPGSADRAA